MRVKVIDVRPAKTGVSKYNGKAYKVQAYKVMEMCSSQAQRAQWFEFTLRNEDIATYKLQKGDIIDGDVFLNLRKYTNVDGTEHESNEVQFINIMLVQKGTDGKASGTATGGYYAPQPNTAPQQVQNDPFVEPF